MKRPITITFLIFASFYAKAQLYHDSTSYDSIRVKNDTTRKYMTIFRNNKDGKSQTVRPVIFIYYKGVFVRKEELKMGIRK